MLKGHIDKCDRGIHYIKIDKRYKKEILSVIKKLDVEGFDYKLLPFTLNDILYSKFSKSICDGFSTINLSHISKPEKKNLFLNGFIAVAYIYTKRLILNKLRFIIPLLCLLLNLGVFWVKYKFTDKQTLQILSLFCIAIVDSSRILTMGYLSKISYSESSNKTR